MSEWIEIPACRVLKVEGFKLRNEFELLNEKGALLEEEEVIYRVVRKSDRHVFKVARFVPMDCWLNSTFYFEEL